MRPALCLVVAAVAAACLGSTASAANGRLCGQIKHGPRNSWNLTLAGKTTRFKGNTWSVFALPAVPCSTPMKAAAGLLAKWAKTKPGGRLPLKGWLCTKDTVAGHGAGSQGVSCVDFGGNAKKHFVVVMIAPYSAAQFAKLAGG